MRNKPLTLLGVVGVAILMLAGAPAAKAQMACPHQITIGDLFAPPFATSNALVSAFECKIDDKIFNGFTFPNMGVVNSLPKSSFIQFGIVGGAIAVGFVHGPAPDGLYPGQLSRLLTYDAMVVPGTPPPDNMIRSMGLRVTGEPAPTIRSASATTSVTTLPLPGTTAGTETVNGAFLSDNTTKQCTGALPCATDFLSFPGSTGVRVVNEASVGTGAGGMTNNLISVFNFFCEKPNVGTQGGCAATTSPGVPPGPGGVLPPPVGVPEPATLGLLVLGLLGLGLAGRKRRKLTAASSAAVMEGCSQTT